MRVPLDSSRWYTAYDGGGEVSFLGRSLRFRPDAVKRDHETKAALILLRETPPETVGVKVRYKVLKQLRPNARPWEVFWLFFGYRPGAEPRTKTTDYFILKTNGIEIGKAYEEIEQEFLFTNGSPALSIGRLHEVQIQIEGKDLRFLVDGKSVAKSPREFDFNRLYSGKRRELHGFGLYAEDAEIQVDSVELLRRELP
jgi:hypothetical protein